MARPATEDGSTRSPGAPVPTKAVAGERDFLDDLAAVLERHNPDSAESELTNWGGWWRNRYRENPAKARRVLGELKAMVLERRITKRPGAAGVDLWKRML